MIALRLMRRIRGVFASAQPEDRPFDRVTWSFAQARVIVKFYYLVSIYFSAAAIPELHQTALSSDSWDFVWPVAWLSHVDIPRAVDWITFAWLSLSLLAFQFPGSRIVRILFAAALLQVAGVSNSLGGINHGYHAWLWIGVILVLLPSVPMAAEPSRSLKMAYLRVISACQAYLLMIYSLAGLWKLAGGLQAIRNGTQGNFSPEGLSLTLADRILQTGTTPLLADMVIDRLWLSQPMFLGLIYIQFVAIAIVVRPRLHMAWGYFIIAFHIGTWLLMEILFIQHVVLLALFLVYSPFRLARWSLRDALADLPLLGWLARLMPRPARTGLEPEFPTPQ